MSDLREPLRAIPTALPFLLALPWLWLQGVRKRNDDQPWVIGGHRGRIYEDNAGELHAWIRANTDRRIVWIANPGPLVERLRAEGHEVLERNSLAARRQILRAPVLIFSHGEDDLDVLLLLMRPLLGFRVYLNHSLNVIKAGQAMSPSYRSAGPLGRWFQRRVMTDFDALLTSSEREARNFRWSFPHRVNRIFGGGGAHLDGFLRLRGTPAQRMIFYFPTQRDDAEGNRQLDETLRRLVADPRLRAWLEAGGWTFRIGAHINTGSHRVPVDGPFELAPLSDLRKNMSEAALFVSDYSGLTANHLVFDRPIVYFPFDWEQYRQRRSLYEDLDEWAAGPVCRTLDALVETIVTEAWADDARWGPLRARWRAVLFPTLSPVYARNGYDMIRTLAGASSGGG